ncbi:Glycosyltransferase involved in cell wall bisynthesis [Algoriphagus locisalis]|uniref:Glycosyltransferase involved in cell wall bisynthesis n=1 Tax=Algoriphagus locisalis TaxID=305507 RepID=A0A1I6Y5K2_9BACT|nr:glycosyltransferase family 2 protein [Algoriphagus locisalis]SFT45673.1 Glycosyltransferase involved in cell wall bisynthesis [Algoriphagus locisalis]
MKVSLVTVCFNSVNTIKSTMESVAAQDYSDLEYIVIDGNSKDGTQDIIRSFNGVVSRWISEPDNGLYDAMNKGIQMATGDIVGIINSDDFYHRTDAISQVVNAFQIFGSQCIYADIRFVRPDNLKRTVRYYSSKKFELSSFKVGVIPAHPTFFTYRRNFEKFGYYKIDYKIAADFELLVRFLYKHKLSYYYLPIDLLKMRTGGLSTKSWKSNVIINQEDLRACKENGLKTNYFWLYSRYFRKLLELIPGLF